MFINLSNHPSARWEKKQILAAMDFGEIVDIQFPSIPPEFDTQEVYNIADTYYHKCINLLPVSSSLHAIHIAGEPVFCFHIITKLLRTGYNVITSTTERMVKETEDGQKISVFNFIKFRKYEL